MAPAACDRRRLESCFVRHGVAEVEAYCRTHFAEHACRVAVDPEAAPPSSPTRPPRRWPGEAILGGDTRYDREAAAAAGVRFVGLRMEGDVKLERLSDVRGLLDL